MLVVYLNNNKLIVYIALTLHIHFNILAKKQKLNYTFKINKKNNNM